MTARRGPRIRWAVIVDDGALWERPAALWVSQGYPPFQPGSWIARRHLAVMAADEGGPSMAEIGYLADVVTGRVVDRRVGRRIDKADAAGLLRINDQAEARRAYEARQARAA